ncbi:MAG: ribonuclease III [Bacteroidetes bacterium]|nr:ribonuclease III [Bacteroidota bacterium]
MLRFIKKIFGRSTESATVPSSIDEFLKHLHIQTDNPGLYETALTHGSYVQSQVESNERLEFVGDAVLGAAIAGILYEYFPGKNEGKLSKMRSKLVSREALNEIGTLLLIPNFLKHRIGKTEFKSSNNYIGNAFEALMGAIYLDKGYDFTYQYVNERIITRFTDLHELDNEIRDFKSYVIIWAQKYKRNFEFRVEKHGSDEEEDRFLARLLIDGEEIAQGKGRNKKTAQQKAAELGAEVLGIMEA